VKEGKKIEEMQAELKDDGEEEGEVKERQEVVEIKEDKHVGINSEHTIVKEQLNGEPVDGEASVKESAGQTHNLDSHITA